MTDLKLHDNTRLSDHRTCNRYYYFRHERHWTSVRKDAAPDFGTCWHVAQDVIWTAIKKGMDDDTILSVAYAAFEEKWTELGYPRLEDATEDEVDTMKFRNTETAAGMIEEYIKKRRGFIENVELIDLEKAFAVPLDPHDETMFYVGRLDKVIRWAGRVWGVEHKTSSNYAREGYFKRQTLDSYDPNSQIDGYLHALHMLYGKEAKGILVDLALVHKTVHEGFEFVPVEKSVEALNAWLWEARQEIDRIEANQINARRVDNFGFMPAFPRNTNACSHYSGCKYLDICKGTVDPREQVEPPMGFKEEKWEPFDEQLLHDAGLNSKD